MILENPISPGQSVEIVEHLIQRARESASTVTTAGGAGTVAFGPVRAGVVWHLRRLAMFGANAAGSVARVTVGGLGDDSLVQVVNSADPVTSAWLVCAVGEVQIMPGETLYVTFAGADPVEAVTVNIRYDLLEVSARPIAGAIRPRDENGGFPVVPLQGDDAAGSQDRPDSDDLLDRDPLGAACSSCGSPGCSGNCRRHALDGGILTAFPADPSTPSGSDLF